MSAKKIFCRKKHSRRNYIEKLFPKGSHIISQHKAIHLKKLYSPNFFALIKLFN